MAILNLESNYYQFSSTDAVYTSMDAQDCEDRFKGPLESRKSPLSNQNTAVHELSKVAGEIIYMRTHNHDLCVSSLRSDPHNSKADVKGLSRIMLELSITKAKATLSYIHLLNNKATDRIWKQYFSVCIEQYVIADKVLRSEIVDLDSNDYGDSTTNAHYAGEAAQDCEDVFKGPPETRKSPLTRKSALTNQNNALERYFSGCIEEYEIAENFLETAILNLGSNNYREATTHADYASSSAQECEDLFKGPPEPRKSPLTNQNKALHDLADLVGEIIYILVTGVEINKWP
ncbi:unnamed protein product [Ilex paraguariensis]|uniref:Pectinesterase inhibitor domain-containing protein n=1 Tax=Ilex paraguariensis TaxID=185542 RepID=A0ABC8RLT4_9AQUA